MYVLLLSMFFSGFYGSITPPVAHADNSITFIDNFDNEEIGPKPNGGGWTTVTTTTYGSTEIVADPTPENPDNQSLKLTDNDYDPNNAFRSFATATRTVPAQSGTFTFETRVRIEKNTTTDQHFNISFVDNNWKTAAKLLYTGGAWRYYPKSGTPIQLSGTNSLDKWTTIRVTFDTTSGKYNLTVGAVTLTGLDFVESVSALYKVLYLPQNHTGVYYIDYLALNNTVPVWTNGTLTASDKTATTVKLAWSGASDDSGVIAKYHIYQGTALVGTTAGDVNSTTLNNVPQGTHLYRVEAEDALGHISVGGPTVSVEFGGVFTFKDSFDDEVIGPMTNRDGWTEVSSNGNVEIVADPTPENPDNQSLKFTDSDYDPAYPFRSLATATRTLPAQSGKFTLETRVRIEEHMDQDQHFNISFIDNNWNQAAKLLYSGGAWNYYPKTGSPIRLPGTNSLGKWTTIKLAFDTEQGKYDLTVTSEGTGTFTLQGLDIIGGISQVTKVLYLPQNFRGIYYVDYLAINDAAPIWKDGDIAVADKTTNRVTLTWSDASVEGFTISGYSVFNGNNLAGSTNGDIRTITLTNLPAGTHTFRVQARDVDGNLIAGGPAVIVTLLDVSNLPKPPSEHPRLFMRAQDIPSLKVKLAKSPYWKKVSDASLITHDGVLKGDVSNNYDEAVLNVIKAKALVSLLNQDSELGRAAVDMMKNYLGSLKFPAGSTDFSRDAGTVLTGGAMVYDWTYQLLTPEEKDYFVDKFITLFKNHTQFGYPPKLGEGGSVTGHRTENGINRDLLSAGVAIFDEFDEMYYIAAKIVLEEFKPARNFLFTAGMHYQGDSYGQERYSFDALANLIFAGMGYTNAFDSVMGDVPYRTLYTRRPDGDQLKDGDSWLTPNRGADLYLSNTFLYTARFYNNPYFKAEFEREYAKSDYKVDAVLAFLFHDPDQESKPMSELPLSRYFGSPVGSMVARTGWNLGIDSHDVVAEMKVSEYHFGNHNHLDTGAFQIYYKGSLAIDSGIYKIYTSAHSENYYRRTIAHNSMLVYNHHDQWTMWGGKAISNDGGVKFPNDGKEAQNINEIKNNGYKMSEIAGQGFGPDPVQPDYTYLKGDHTNAYQDRVSKYTRSTVFLNLKNSLHPAAMIVYDRVNSKDPSFQKYWLLHSEQEPIVVNNVTTITRNQFGYNGKLVNTSLLPLQDDLRIEKVGGVDANGNSRQFDVFGTNYGETRDGVNTGIEPGEWRIQISPKTPRTDDDFLNVIQVMDNIGGPSPLVTVKVEAGDMVGAKISDRVVLFSKSGDRLKGSIALPDYGEEDNLMYVITDLSAGYWTVEREGAASRQIQVTQEGSVLSFNGPAEAYKLTWSATQTMPIEQPPVWTKGTVTASGINANQVDLTWSGADSSQHEVTAYKVFDSGELVKIVQGNSNNVTLTNMTPGNHTFRVEAVYASGIMTDTGPSVTVKLQNVYQISGSISIAGVGPADLATVEVRTPEGFLVKSVVSDAEGRYSVGNLPVGEYSITVVRARSDKFSEPFTIADRDITKNIVLTPMLDILSATASSTFNGQAIYSIDGNLTTSWVGQGIGVSVTYDLGEIQNVNRVDLLFGNAAIRKNFFDIAVSTDGVTFTTVYSGSSSGTSSAMQQFLFDPAPARYVKFIGNGNNGPFSEFTTLLELVLYEKPVTVVGFEPVAVHTIAGTAPVLPSVVTAVYSNQTQAAASVIWDSIDPSQYADENTFTVQGTVSGTAIRPQANVAVDAKILATGAPGKPVLSSDNGQATGLKDGNFSVTMNMWWGNNGTRFKLYENGVLISDKKLGDASPSAQTVKTAITGKANGTYTYTCELINSFGTKVCNPFKVVITDALPGKPVLSDNNWDGDGSYNVTMNMWWGTNATAYRLYENGVLIDSQSIITASPQSQQAVTTIAGRGVGTYEYTCELINAAGTTTSQKLTVIVNQ